MSSTYRALLASGRADERSLVQLVRAGDRAIVTLSDPERLNALSAGLMVQLLLDRDARAGGALAARFEGILSILA